MSRIHPSDQNKSHLLLDCLRKNQQNNIGGNGGVTYDDDEDGATTKISPVPVPVSIPTPRPTVLTVWKRSSMSFQGTDGFTVFDHHGVLAFRVDNYSRKSHLTSWSCVADAGAGGSVRALVLMDGSGKPLLTLKPQMFSMQHQWNGYRGGEEDDGCGTKITTSSSRSRLSRSTTNRVFTMRRPISTSVLELLGSHHRSCEGEVFMENNTVGGTAETAAGPTTPALARSQLPDFRIEGSFWRRNCKIKDPCTGEVAAKIVRKRATAKMSNISGTSTTSSTIMLSDDVFTLLVQPPFDPQLIMAFVVILDRICIKPFATPLICS